MVIYSQKMPKSLFIMLWQDMAYKKFYLISLPGKVQSQFESVPIHFASTRFRWCSRCIGSGFNPQVVCAGSCFPTSITLRWEQVLWQRIVPRFGSFHTNDDVFQLTYPYRTDAMKQMNTCYWEHTIRILQAEWDQLIFRILTHPQRKENTVLMSDYWQ